MSELLAFLLGLLTNEVGEVAPWLAKRIIRFYVGFLPKESQLRYREEFFAEIENVPGSLTKLLYTLKILSTVISQVQALQSSESDSKTSARNSSLQLQRVFIIVCTIVVNVALHGYDSSEQRYTTNIMIVVTLFINYLVAALMWNYATRGKWKEIHSISTELDLISTKLEAAKATPEDLKSVNELKARLIEVRKSYKFRF